MLHLDGSGPNAHVWGLLAALLAKTGALSIASAFNVVLIAAIVCAFAGAWLRTWGAAYLGTGVVHDANLRGDSVVADGPFRHVRNPLYLGSWLNLLALALLMPASGAVFAIVMLIVFHLRLVFIEEAFLRVKLGEPYTAYCAKVPRMLYSVRARVPASGAKPRWLAAVVTEIFMWGSAVSFAVLGWRYNAMLLLQCVLVSVGVSLVVKAFTKSEPEAAS